MIGVDGAAAVMDKDVYDHCHDLCNGPRELIVKLLDKVIPPAELAVSSFHGGENFRSEEHEVKPSLRKNVNFRALVAQAELQYPEETSSAQFQTKLRTSFNSKCRKIDLI